MNVGELMTKNVRTCTPTDTLNLAAQLMWEGDYGCVPIVDAHGFVLGMLTDRDICMAAYTQGKPLHEIAVSVAMSWHVFGCSADDELEHAETLMRRNQVRRLPVTDLCGRLVGLLSLNDIVKHVEIPRQSRGDGLNPVAVTRTLADIGKPPQAQPVKQL